MLIFKALLVQVREDICIVKAGGKTGNSQESVDAWSVGLAGNTVARMWFGNDDRAPMRGVTWRLALSDSSWRQVYGSLPFNPLAKRD